MKSETRFVNGTVGVEQRADGTKFIAGYASVFYRAGEAGTEFKLWDNLVERVMPGTFDDAIQQAQDVRGLFNHDPNCILGRTKAGTCRLSVDARGLRYEIDPPKTQLCADLMESISRGDVTGSSFSFRVVDQAWITEGEQEIREIRKVELFDVGPVTFPAYEATEAGLRAARSQFDQHKEQEQQRRDSITQKLGQYRARAASVLAE